MAAGRPEMSNATAEVAIFLAPSLAVIAVVVLLAQSATKAAGRERPSEDKSLDRYSH
jgi:hypothetical protein